MDVDGVALPDNWVLTEFGTLFKIQGGTQPPRSQHVSKKKNGYVRFIQIRDFASDEHITYIPDTGKLKYCQDDDILIARYGASLGRICRGKSGAYNVALVKVLFDKKQIDADWVYYLLQSPWFQEPLFQVSRSAQEGFNQSELYPRLIPLAPLPEQRRIAKDITIKTSRVRAVREQLGLTQPLLRKFRQSIFAKAFSGELTKDWREQQTDLEPVSALLDHIRVERKKLLGKKYKEAQSVDKSDLTKLPMGWEWVRLGEICLLNPKHKADLISANTAVTFTPMPAIDAKLGEIVDYQERPFDKVRKGYTHFSDGDVLFAKITPCMENGKAAIARNLKNGIGCGSTELHVLRPLLGISAEYIYYYVRQEIFRKRAEANMTGTAGQLRVPVDFIREHIFPLPSIKEQAYIVGVLNKALERMNLIEGLADKTLLECERLPQAILAKAFRGELVEQDPNDEPASVLLKKIREKKK